MERTMVSVNVPNIITINLIAWVGFLIVVAIFQMISKRRGKRPDTAPGITGGSTLADLEITPY